MLFKKRNNLVIKEFILSIYLIVFLLNKTTATDQSFIATFPSSVIPGSQVKFCIGFQNLQTPVTFFVFDDFPHAFVKFELKLNQNDPQTCIDVKISATAAHLKKIKKTIEIKGSSLNGDYQFHDKKFFQVKKQNSFTIIETDKPIYKPGQKIRIRVLTLDYLLRPLTTIYKEIYIKDSSDSIIYQWTDIENKNGLIELEMPISDEPNLGNWKLFVKLPENKVEDQEEENDDDINEEEKEVSIQFQIKKYILPKFEVQLKHKSIVRLNEEKVQVQVCAKYSYGKDVDGLFKLLAYTKRYSYQSQTELVHKQIEPSVLAGSLNRGCVNFEFKIIDLDIPSHHYFQEIYLDALVTEANTSIVANASSKIVISYRTMEIKVLEPAALHYKPGFPIQFKILLKSVNENEINNESVSIELKTATTSKELHREVYKTDHQGIVQFTFEPNENNCDEEETKCEEFNIYRHLPEQLSLKVSVDWPLSLEKKYTQIRKPIQYFSLKPWFSPSATFLTLNKEKEEDCQNNYLKLKIRLKSLSKLNSSLYFQVSDGSGMLFSGHYDPESEKTSQWSSADSTLVYIKHLNTQKVPLATVDLSKRKEKCTNWNKNIKAEQQSSKAKTGGGFEDRSGTLDFKKIMTSEPLRWANWFYDFENNECISRMIYSSDDNENKRNKKPLSSIPFTNDGFITKEKCENECKLYPILYNSAGALITTNNLLHSHVYDSSYEFLLPKVGRGDLSVLIYVIKEDKEIIVDQIKVANSCGDQKQKHQVHLTLDKELVSVGQRVQLSVTADPNCLCAISAVDKSVTFFSNNKLDNRIQLNKVKDLIHSKFASVFDKLNEYKSTEVNQTQNCTDWPSMLPMPRVPMPQQDNVLGRDKRSLVYPFGGGSPFLLYDATKAFREHRVLYLSDLGIYQEDKCSQKNHGRPPMMMMDMPMPIARSGGKQALQNKKVAQSIQQTEEIQIEEEEMTSPQSTKISLANTIRTYFPETWIWSLQMTSDTGEWQKSEQVPDSITTWLLSSYCLSTQNGLGISAEPEEQQELRVFQPLFVTVDLPYAVIRNETFPVLASVLNYESVCVPVLLEIAPRRTKFAIAKDSVRFIERCVCPEQRLTHSFRIRALSFVDDDEKDNNNNEDKGIPLTVRVKSVDNNLSIVDSAILICSHEQMIDSNKKIRQIQFSDSVTRRVLVEPEGIPKELVISELIVLKLNETTVQSRLIEIQLPNQEEIKEEEMTEENKEVIVRKSVRSHILLTGDLMGPVLGNLQHLVQQPTGCGEQNMVKYAPIVSVRRYLTSTGQLTKKLGDQTLAYLQTGYQRQLTYRHPDGSFSAFGPSSSSQKSGGTFLTAFVLRCFAESSDLLQVNSSKSFKINLKDIRMSIDYLFSIQTDEGSFPSVGAPLYSKALSGGLQNQEKKSIALTAYVLIALLKTTHLVEFSDYDREQLEHGLQFLRSVMVSSSLNKLDTYSLALIFNVQKMIMQTKFKNDLMQRQKADKDLQVNVQVELKKRAIRQNGFVYWTTSSSEKKSDTKSVDLETTAYILLAKLYDSNLIKEEEDSSSLSEISQIAKWINSQRNSLGGFYSTQDTVVALDALAKFASKFHSKQTNVKVIQTCNGKLLSVNFINEKNKMLVQHISLGTRFNENQKNKIQFELSGEGSALFQVIVKYNLVKETKQKYDESEFEFSIFSTQSTYGSTCDYAQLIINTKYIGMNEHSSMAIVSLRLPTGWIPLEETVEKLKNTVELKRYEINENRMFLYFDQLNANEKELKIDVVRKFYVKDAKPGLLSVYDYYQPMDEAMTHPYEIADGCKKE